MRQPYKQTATINIYVAPWSARTIFTKNNRDYFTHKKEVIYLSQCTTTNIPGFSYKYAQTETTGLIIQRHDATTLIIYTYEKRTTNQ